ncbi:MAG: hypothetical protein ACREDS_15260, partial [Limisphaerales bacterium]
INQPALWQAPMIKSNSYSPNALVLFYENKNYFQPKIAHSKLEPARFAGSSRLANHAPAVILHAQFSE